MSVEKFLVDLSFKNKDNHSHVSQDEVQKLITISRLFRNGLKEAINDTEIILTWDVLEKRYPGTITSLRENNKRHREIFEICNDILEV